MLARARRTERRLSPPEQRQQRQEQDRRPERDHQATLCRRGAAVARRRRPAACAGADRQPVGAAASSSSRGGRRRRVGGGRRRLSRRLLGHRPVGGSGRVYVGVAPRLGVGSKRVHPTPSKYSSGQACASRSPTEVEPSAWRVPGVKPTATRAGMSRVRAIAAIVKEKWMQNPSLSRRNRAIAPRSPSADLTEVSYVKPPSEANQLWSFDGPLVGVGRAFGDLLGPSSATTFGSESGTCVYSLRSFSGGGPAPGQLGRRRLDDQAGDLVRRAAGVLPVVADEGPALRLVPPVAARSPPRSAGRAAADSSAAYEWRRRCSCRDLGDAGRPGPSPVGRAGGASGTSVSRRVEGATCCR
ncbi:hypothetical protein SCYAM73S_03242 [Streptomyces cyaneofuscatus]